MYRWTKDKHMNVYKYITKGGFVKKLGVADGLILSSPEITVCPVGMCPKRSLSPVGMYLKRSVGPFGMCL